MIIYIVHYQYDCEVWFHRSLKEAKKQKSYCEYPNAVTINKIEVPRNKDGVIWAMSQVPR